MAEPPFEPTRYIMDCEKFQAAMMDELTGELDEAARAALKRHLPECARCRAALERIQATARIAPAESIADPQGGPHGAPREPVFESLAPAMPGVGSSKESPPSSAPFGRRFADLVSVAGSWAMRPETAMAALFLVMTGTSVLLLRGKSSRAPANAEITVTEEGSPAPSAATLSPPSRPAAIDPSSAPTIASSHSGERSAAGSSAAAIATTGSVAAPYASALSAYQAGRFDDARRAFDAIAAGDPAAELWAARAVRDARGCRAAIARFDHAAQRAAGTPPGGDALFEGARCRVSLGDYAGARSRFEALLGVDSLHDRAQAELDRILRIQRGRKP